MKPTLFSEALPSLLPPSSPPPLASVLLHSGAVSAKGFDRLCHTLGYRYRRRLVCALEKTAGEAEAAWLLPAGTAYETTTIAWCRYIRASVYYVMLATLPVHPPVRVRR